MFGRALICVLLFSGFFHVRAGAQTAQLDPSIRITLERAFESWRQAMAAKNLQQWEAATAFSRQIETRNRIVSQKLPFPAVLFDDPIEAPSLTSLISLGVLSTGQTATSTYYGKANFGGDGGASASDNMLVLHFLKEDGVWRYDNMRIVKFGADAEVLLQIRNGDFSFLSGAEFQPAPQLPPVVQPVSAPDYIAEVWIDATGYEVSVFVNGHPSGKFANIKITELIMGGVKKGGNAIRLECRKIDGVEGATSKVEVAIYSAPDANSQANRVYHYRPVGEPLPVVTESFSVQ